VKDGDGDMMTPSDKHLVSKKMLKNERAYYFIAEHLYCGGG